MKKARVTLHPFGRIAAAVVAVSLLLTGCQTAGNGANANVDAPAETEVETHTPIELTPLAEVEPAEDPSSLTGPTHTLVGGPTFQPIAENPTPQLPATVVSKDLDGGRPEITVTDVSRIIAISITGTLADYVVALGLGDNLVGKDTATTAAGTEDLPEVTGSGHVVNVEGIIALGPTVVLTDGSLGPDDVVRIQLRDAGIPVVAVERISGFQSSYDAARDVAAALGVPEQGELLAAEIEESVDAKIAEIRATILPEDESKRPRVVFLYLRGTKVYYMFGEGSGIDAIIDAVGAIDIATEQGWRGSKPVTPEALVAMNPDAILVMTKGLESVGGVDELIEQLSGVAQTKAGQNRRIIDVEDALILAGGTRTADVIDGVARALYAPDSLQQQ